MMKHADRTSFDTVVDAAIHDGTTDPDGLPFYRCKFNDAGEFFGVTQIEEES